MTNNTASIIREARQLITSREKWAQGSLATAADGTPAFPENPNAVCFCMLGALCRVAKDPSEAAAARDTLRKVMGRSFISTFNDTHTHEEVLALLDKAALAAEDAA